METFRYKAMTATGAILRGSLDATSEHAAVQQLRRQGYVPVSAMPASAGGASALLGRMRRRRRASMRVLQRSAEELAALLQAGIELDRALTILARLNDLTTIKDALEDVRERVRAGSSLADALGAKLIFPPFFVSMVRAGELSGTLAPTLGRAADYLRRTIAVRESIGSALVYPAILLVTAGFSIAIILFMVLPEFKPLFAEAGNAIPLPTRVLLDIGDLVAGFWWVPAVLIAGSVTAAMRWLKDSRNREIAHARILRVPVIGNLALASETERFSRTLGTLLSNGIPLPTALLLTKDVLWNAFLANEIRETATRLREGDSLAVRLQESNLFSSSMVDLVRIGEETGKLPELLLRQADLDEHGLRHAVERLLALLVPALTIGLGIIVAGLIASMLIAILSVNNLALQ